MVLLPVGRGVVGRYGLDGDVVARTGRITRHHHVTVEVEGLGRRLVAEQIRFGGLERLDGRAVEVVVVGVSHQNEVGLGQRRVVGIFADGVDVDVLARHLDGQRAVFDEGHCKLGTVAGREGIRRKFGGVRCAAAEE